MAEDEAMKKSKIKITPKYNLHFATGQALLCWNYGRAKELIDPKDCPRTVLG